MSRTQSTLAVAGCLSLMACGDLATKTWPDRSGKDAGPDASTDTSVASGSDGTGKAGSNLDIAKTPPTGQWLSPKPGSVVSLGQEVTFTAEVASTAVAIADLSVAVTLATGPLPGSPPLKVDAGGKVTFTTTLLPPGAQTVVLKVMDGGNPATLLPLPVYVDSPPGTPEVAILPAKPGGLDDLVAKVLKAGTDVDLGQQATQTYLYEWRVNEVPSDVTAATVPASKTQATQTWSVQVRAFDGVMAGPPGVAWVTIGNTLPVLPTLAIEPTAATVADTVTCAMPVAATDVDGQDLAFKPSWTLNGKPFVQAGNKGVLPLAQFVAGKNGKPGAFQQMLPVKAGDVLQCQVLVSDGADIAGPATSTAVTLLPFDGCQHSEAPCALAATCTPTQTAEVTCTCKPGFVGDGKACTDENECLTGSNACDPAADCTNTFGSYTCGCPAGFTGDGWKCQDVDECAAATSPCDLAADCTNTLGGFACVCKPGYADATGKCVDKDECLLGLQQCDPHATCVNLPGSVTCTCDLGWAATETNGAVSCVDLNECATATACVEGALCSNFAGGFDCTCGPGWIGDGKTCSNVDECKQQTFVCAAEATCQDMMGDYLCVCGKGWIGDGKTCDDVDECAGGNNQCDPKALCTNKPGGYDCACKPGFEGDGKSCKAAQGVK